MTKPKKLVGSAKIVKYITVCLCLPVTLNRRKCKQPTFSNLLGVDQGVCGVLVCAKGGLGGMKKWCELCSVVWCVVCGVLCGVLCCGSWSGVVCVTCGSRSVV
jgi:hypothetical protein